MPEGPATSHPGAPASPGLRIRLLGPLQVERDGVPVELPRSRKVRVLLAYLALEPASASRSRLCDLLWNTQNDPRGELRWALSKLRAVLDDAGRKRVTVAGRGVRLELGDCFVDAVELERLAAAGFATATTEALVAAATLPAGELLEGDEVDETPELSAWTLSRRQRLRALRAGALAEVARRMPEGSDAALRYLELWLQLAPFELSAHQALVAALVAAGRSRDADAHVSSAIRAHEQEGLDWAPLHAWWMAERNASSEVPRPSVAPGQDVAPGAGGERPREPGVARRAAVAVMPFVDATPLVAPPGELVHGLTDDIITRLAKLRVLFVIARGTTYALGERGVDALEAGRILDVDYVVSGRVRRGADGARVAVELAGARDAKILWADELHGAPGDPFSVLDTIVDRIVTSIAGEIEAAECQRAMLKPASSLDAWEAYHRGLWHMYRFTGEDNHVAAELFRRALALDPTFSRALSGLSFTHFQNVFLELTDDRPGQLRLALETAGRSLAADARDPAAHWAMGRALWLGGETDGSVAELEQSVALSPNFALGHYTLGFVHSQSGDPVAAIGAVDTSRRLSPFDPLQFGMLGSLALAHLRMGELHEAADWAVKAARRPNAHAHILAIAASCLSLAGRADEGRAHVAGIRERLPSYGVETFLRAFRFEPATERLLRRAAPRVGLG